MIHIEKLSLKNIGKYSWQTFVDHLLGTKETRRHILEKNNSSKARTFISTNIISTHVFSKLEGVALGKYFGFGGIDIDELLVSSPNIENLVIEISVDNINSLPKQKLKKLLESHYVMLNDFEENGTLYGPPNPHLIEILTKFDIKPKMLFLVGACFNLHDYPDLNIYKIPYEYWIVSTATISEYFSQALFNSTFKQSLLDRLTNTPPKFCAAPMFKPRTPRVELLAHLDKNGMLEKTDWSLAYNLTQHLYTGTMRYSNNDNFTEFQQAFLQKYELPRFLEGPSSKWQNVISPLVEWFNTYKFFICAETYMGKEIDTPLGDASAITEKTYKSFMLGSIPITYGPKNSISHLKKYGFKLPFDEMDTTNPTLISSLVQDLYTTQPYNYEYAAHNFNQITDLNYLTDIVCEPLHKIAELINSIRR